MKIMRRRYNQVLACLLISVSMTYAGNNLKVMRTATNTLEVQLANSELVAGVQFNLHTSSDIVLGELEHGNRTAESHWMVASYKPNDSTINVIILSMEQKTFSAGQGTLVRLSFSTINPLDESTASFANVMVTDSQADSLGIAINNLTWNNNSSIAANGQSKTFVLGQNYPNPFNPSTRIAYQVKKATQVQLSVYDIAGREVSRLVDQYQQVGDYSVEWNSNTSSGQKLSSGIYFARLMADNNSATRKLIMTK
jgi:hypothetical protein